MRDRSCSVCGESNGENLDTYKHVWFFCRLCLSATRFRKSQYWIPRFFPTSIARMMLPGVIFNYFFHNKAVIENSTEYYRYYEDTVKKGDAGTKWEGELEKTIAEITPFSIDLSDKTILDVSGGPGFFAKGLSRKCKKVIVTEYAKAACDGMQKVLGIEARELDYNQHDLKEVFEERFDFIFIRYSINFCLNLSGFVKSLHSILNPGGSVYVSFVPPTLGTCLRWQYDDYTYLALFDPTTMTSIFKQNGLTVVGTFSHPSTHCLDRPWKFKMIHAPLILVYWWKARIQNFRSNPEIFQRNLVHIYRKEA